MFVVYVVVYFLDTFHYNRNFLILSEKYENLLPSKPMKFISYASKQDLNY